MGKIAIGQDAAIKKFLMADASETILKKKQMRADAPSMMEAAQIIDFKGHLSARSGADSLLINSSVSVRSAIAPADIVQIDLGGNLIGDGPVPPIEFPIHASIYRSRPEVGAVAHIHPVWSTLFSSVGKKVEPVTMQAAMLGQIQELEQTASINTKTLGDAVAECRGKHRVALPKAHGAVIAAEGILEVFTLSYYLEETAHRQYLASHLGSPAVLTPEQVEEIQKKLWKPHLLEKV
jgi:ribulose-5-phosphate 4-epimerase/fuculose-1-phosphate aldolase